MKSIKRRLLALLLVLLQVMTIVPTNVFAEGEEELVNITKVEVYVTKDSGVGSLDLGNGKVFIAAGQNSFKNVELGQGDTGSKEIWFSGEGEALTTENPMIFVKWYADQNGMDYSKINTNDGKEVASLNASKSGNGLLGVNDKYKVKLVDDGLSADKTIKKFKLEISLNAAASGDRKFNVTYPTGATLSSFNG